MRQIAIEKTPEMISQLMEYLDDSDVEYRRTIVQTLGVIGLDAVALLATELNHNCSDVYRTSCAKALGAIALNYPEVNFPEIALLALQKSLQDDSPIVKLASVGALGTIGKPALDILISGLEIDDIALQVAIISALGCLGETRAISVLTNLASNLQLDPYIRQSAASARSRIA